MLDSDVMKSEFQVNINSIGNGDQEGQEGEVPSMHILVVRRH